jgi:hypothetical protein
MFFSWNNKDDGIVELKNDNENKLLLEEVIVSNMTIKLLFLIIDMDDIIL